MKSKNETPVLETFLFDNGMVSTFDTDGNQITELQGVYSTELKEAIQKRSNNKTKWTGFYQITS